MECIDLESTLSLGDSEIVQVDFLHELQQSMSKFQKQLDELSTRVESIEKTTIQHQQLCICMSKLSNNSSSITTLAYHPEISRVDNRITSLDRKMEQLKQEFKQFGGTGKFFNDIETSSSSLPRILRNSANSNIRKTSHQPLPPPPPPLKRMVPTTTAGSSSFSKTYTNNVHSASSAYHQQQQQQGQEDDSYLEHEGTEFEEEDEQEMNFNHDDDEDGEGRITYSIGEIKSEIIEDDDDGLELDDEEEIEIQPEIMFDDEFGGGQDDSLNDEDDMSQYLQQEDEYDMEQEDYNGSGQITMSFNEEENVEEEEDVYRDGQPVEFRDVRGNSVRAFASTRTGKIRCPSCPVQCMSRRNIVRHYNNKHADPQTHECPICGSILNRKDSLHVHMRNQHNVVEQNGQLVSVFVADADLGPGSASTATKKQSTSSTSTNSAAVPIEIQYNCNICRKVFTTPNALAAHHKTKHAPMAPRPTSIIKKEIPDLKPIVPKKTTLSPATSAGSSSSTTATASEAALQGRKCPFCYKTFAFRRYLLRHLKSHTEENKCVACGKVYSRRDKLRQHQREKHGGVLDDRNYIVVGTSTGVANRSNRSS